MSVTYAATLQTTRMTAVETALDAGPAAAYLEICSAAYASILAAGISWFWLFYDSNWGQHEDYLVFGLLPVATIVAASTLSLIMVSLVTSPPEKKTLQKFFASV